ncbi:glycosyltransferase family 2 protein [Deinococcus psychrotolerans]|uniref:Glycosyltransferase family 2 protein n=1 Tax=Deinococcus psychrotolerans TaxID=2489213 RepID=A0A3G8YCX7_9DEIO|nr:glycosyltransferase family 2 protein [Deinococcus psychrotolerans]AZI42077.1 glycosyltransferase family 2 protein [Deinococcus psychrotolerans]
MSQPFLSVCIPAYNRAQFLGPLLDSILSQNYGDYEIVICEDLSPQREAIAQVVRTYKARTDKIRYIENVRNLGYDANFRELLTQACGEYCFFMGNDDLMADGALSKVSEVLHKHSNIGLILRSYDWFIDDYRKPEQTIQYFASDRIFPPGEETIATAYRRCGVLSGYVIHRESAMNAATEEFDGFLFYQMYLAASVLVEKGAYYVRDVLTHSRSTETPDFGNSAMEKGIFTPGTYTPEARIHMITGMLTIARTVDKKSGLRFANAIERDIANYVYPYISDQLNLPLPKYLNFLKKLKNLGLGKHKMFYAHAVTAYILKQNNYNKMTTFVRNKLGKSPQIGKVYAGIEAK